MSECFIANNLCKTGARYYHSQTLLRQSNGNKVEKQMTLPPNLMFDFKSSFAPQRTELVSQTPDIEELDDGLKNKELAEDDEISELDSDIENSDDESSDDEFEDDYPLVFHANTTNHRPVQPLPDRLQVNILDGPNASEDTV